MHTFVSIGVRLRVSLPRFLREIGQHQLGLHFSTVRFLFLGIIRLRAKVPVLLSILVWPLVLREIGQHQLGLHFSTIRIMFHGIIRLRAVVPGLIKFLQ